jgi:hypothetical protein
MRLAGILMVALLTAAFGLPGGRAQASSRTRPMCRRYRCTTVAQDGLVRVLRVASRHPEDESEAELRHSAHWAVWKPTGRASPFGDLPLFEGVQRLVLAGTWVGFTEKSCDHESMTCAYTVDRLDARTGHREQNPGAHVVAESEQEREPGFGCFPFNTVSGPGITALVLAKSGTIAWIQYGHVCGLSHGASVSVLLASGPDIAPHSLRLADGRVYWKEEVLHSAPLA